VFYNYELIKGETDDSFVKFLIFSSSSFIIVESLFYDPLIIVKFSCKEFMCLIYKLLIDETSLLISS